MSRYVTEAVYETIQETDERDAHQKLVSPKVVHWDLMYADLGEMCGIAEGLPVCEGIALSPFLRAAWAMVGERRGLRR